MILTRHEISTKIIRLVLLFILISSTSYAQSNNDSLLQKKQWTIDECVNVFNMEDTVGTNVGYQYWFFDKDFIDGRTIKMSVVAPHSATHKPHKHSEDEFFFVLEGTAEFYLDGKTMTGEKYSAFYCPQNIEHGIRNIGETELKYLVIKKYENIK
jgi:mannose-6-phosphate isomerase-like protein (cupin superfamily)